MKKGILLLFITMLFVSLAWARGPINDIEPQVMNQRKIDAKLHGTTFQVNSRDEDITITVTVDSWYGEASWNLWDDTAGAYYWGTAWTFSAGYETQIQTVFLANGLYSVDCWDSYGDGGIAGVVEDASANVLVEWTSTAYTSFGEFWFEVGAIPVEFTVTPAAIDETLAPDAATDVPVTITNIGGIGFDYTTSTSYPLWSFDVQTAGGETGNLGAEFDGTYFWTTSRGLVAPGGNQIFKWDANGNFLAAYDQGTTSSWGMRDMAWDPVSGYLYAGDDNGFYQIDPADGTVTTLFAGQTFGVIRALALLPDGTFWTKSFTGDITIFDIAGNVINTYTTPESAYGAAYDDVNDCVWVFEGTTANDPLTTFSQWDVTTALFTGVTIHVPLLDGLTAQIIGGAFYHDGKLGGMVQGTPVDTVFEMDLDHNTQAWLNVTANGTGTVPIGGAVDVTVNLDATGLLDGAIKNGNLAIAGTAGLSTQNTDVPVTLTVQAGGVVYTLPFAENFEGGVIPTDWTMTTNSIGWFVTLDGSSTYWTIPTGDGYYACSNDDAAGSTGDGSMDYLTTPEFDLTGVTGTTLTFDSYYDGDYGQIATVEASTDGSTWTIVNTLAPGATWETLVVDLSAYDGESSVWFAFHSDDGGSWASGWAFDNVSIEEAAPSVSSYLYSTHAGAGNPGGLNTNSDSSTTGWTEILPASQSVNMWSTPQTIPFAFEYFGLPVTDFKVSLNGLVTFDTTAPEPPADVNYNLPSVDLPDNTMAMFWDNFTLNPPTATNDRVYTKLFGTAPDQQLWIRYHSFEYADYSYAYFAMCIEETTNKIYFVDMKYRSGSGHATVGVQYDATTAVEISESPNFAFAAGGSSNADNTYYEFFPVPPGAPTMPSNPNPANNAVNVSVTGDLTWDFGTNTDSYDLWFGPEGAMVQEVISGTAGATGTYTYTAVENTTYNWRVDAINSSLPYTTTGPVWTFSTVIATGVVQIGSGSVTNAHLPIEPFYGYDYSQTIYFPGDFTNIPGGQMISKVWYNYTKTSTDPDEDDWIIWMGLTDETNLDGGFLDISSFTEVFNGSVGFGALAPGEGWLEILLTTPFYYDPTFTGNLVIAVDENTPSYAASSDEFFNTPAGNVSRYYYSDSTNPDPFAPPSGTIMAAYPNIRFEFIPAPIGYLEGYVYEFGTTNPIEDATVTAGGMSAVTSSTGFYSMTLLAGTYDATADHANYFPQTVSVVITEGVTTVQDFGLEWSEILLSPTSFTVTLAPDATADEFLTITNNGTHDLTYNCGLNFISDNTYEPVIKKRITPVNLAYNENDIVHNERNIPAINSDALFDLQFQYATAISTGEAGVETDGNYIYTAKWNGDEYYRYAMDGTYIETFLVAGTASVRDLAWDGTYFYGAAANTSLFQMDFTPGAEILVSTITAPVACRAIAYDNAANGFWANNWSDAITLFDMTGAFISSFPCGTAQSFYGFAYDDFLAGGPYLWGFSQNPANTLVQFDIATGLETGVFFDVGALAGSPGGSAGGMFISDACVPGYATLGCMIQNEWIVGLELCVTETWLSITNNGSGVVPAAGGTIDVTVHFDATGYTAGEVKTGEIIVNSDAITGQEIVPASMNVAAGAYPLPFAEDFSGGVVPPTDWLIIGDGQGNWSSSSTNNAGGTSPEAEFSWSPSFTGASYFTTPELATAGMSELALEYKHFLNDYSGSGYSIGVATTSDGGVTWNIVNEVFPTGDIGPETVYLTVATPDVGSDAFQLAFFFNGDSYDLDYWYIDDISIVEAGAELPAVFISEYIEGSSNNKALEIYNNTGDVINLDDYRIAQAVNGGGWAYWHIFPVGATLAYEDVWVILNADTDPTLFDPANADEVLGYPSVVHHNGDDARAMEYTTDGGTTWIQLDVFGDPDNDPGVGWDVAGVVEATKDHTLVRKDEIIVGNTVILASFGTDPTDSEWVVHPQNTFDYLGWHIVPPPVLDPPENLTATVQNQVDVFLDWDAPSAGALWEQLANVSAEGGISSQDFEASFDAYDAEGADEFIVPTGETWTINEVVILGTYSVAGPCDLGNVRFYEDAAGMPGTLLYEYLDVPASPNAIGDLDCLIPDTVLPEGTYWLGFQGRLDFGTFGQWFWTKQAAPTIGYEFYWRNPLDGFGTGCTTWTTGSIAYAGYTDYNLSFALYGAVSDGKTTVVKNNINPFMNRSVERFPVKNPDTSLLSRIPTISTGFTGGHSIRDLLGYNVYRDGVVINAALVTDTEYLDIGLPDGFYQYWVTALYDEGESVPSNTVDVTISTVPTATAPFVIADSPDPLTWSFNTYTELGWIDVPVTIPVDVEGDIFGWEIAFDWATDAWPYESDFWAESPSGTLAQIASGLANGTYSIPLGDFNGEPMEGNWMIYITDTYGDGGHQATNITMYITYETAAVPLDPPANLFVTETGYATWDAPPVTIYGDDFESYTVGEYLAVQSADWTTWSNLPGTAEDALISDVQALSGSNSVVVEGTSDLVLIMDNYTSGVYSMELNLLVPTGYCGYWNLQKTNTIGQEWAFQIMFDVTGIASADAGAAAALTFPFSFDTWINMELIIDLDADWCEIWVDGVMLHGYQWTLGTFGTPGLLSLGGMNLYAWASAGNSPMCYFDDIELTEISSDTSDGIVAKTRVDMKSKASENRDLLGYNTYLDGAFVAFTTDLFYDYDDGTLIIGQSYFAEVTALYDEGESAPIGYTFIYQPTPLDPPQNLFVDNLGYATWDAPGGAAGVLAHHSGYDNNGIGTGAAASWTCAARFDATDLATYYGSNLTDVNVHIRTADFSYVEINVWEGGSFGDPGTLVYAQDITASVLIEDWTNHVLTTPVPLVAGNEYWIGYYIDATFDHPSSVDAGPAVPGKGDWMHYAGIWQEISVAFGLDYNWCIEGVVGADDNILAKTKMKSDNSVVQTKQKAMQMRNTFSQGKMEAEFNRPIRKNNSTNSSRETLLGYDVYLDGAFIAFTTDLFYDYDDGTLIIDQSYFAEVIAVYDVGQSAPIGYTFIYQPTPLLPPQNLAVTDQGYATWDAPGGGGAVEFYDDFEAGSGNWNIIINSGSGAWIVYPEPYPNSYTLPPPSAGNVIAADADEAGSGTTTDTTLELAVPLDFSGCTTATIEFDNDFNAIATDDYCYVDVSSDGGTTWDNVLTFAGVDVRNTHEVIDITAYAAGQASVLVRFVSVQPGWDWWWAIDNVHIHGNGGGTGDLYELIQHDGNPVNGYFQAYDNAYGVVYDLSGYTDVTIEMVDFRHSSWGVYGTWDYSIHIVDWDTFTLLAEVTGLQTTGDDIWEEGITLGSIPESGLVGIFMEPMGNTPTDAYPCIDADDIGPDGLSYFGPLPDYSGFGLSGIGDFLMDLWIMANPVDGFVKAPRFKANYGEGVARIQTTHSPVKFVELNQTAIMRDHLGYNVYLDTVFEVFTTDEFYLYTGLNNGQDYVAGVSALYDEGESIIIEEPFTYLGGDPGISVDPTVIYEIVDPDEIVVVPLMITNTGTAELTYNITIVEYTSDQYRAENRKPSFGQSYGQTRDLTQTKPDDPAFNERDPDLSNHVPNIPATDDLFDWQFEWPVGVGGGEAGIETDGDYIYTTKWNGTTFFRYAMDGTYIEEFSVTGCPGAIRDLAYDGTYFYGAAATNTVYEMDFNSQTVISTITAPVAVRAIAYDPVADGFWANNWSSTITLFDRNGTTLDSFPCGVFQSYYGFAWEDQLADGPYLWGYAQDGASDNQLVQFDIALGQETGVNFDIGSIFTVGTGIAGGMCISDEFVPGTWTICGTSQNTIIWGVELCAGDEPWISVDPISGTVPAGGVDIVDVTLDATGLIGVTKTADIIIANNTGVDVIVPVTMEVTGIIPLDPPENLFVTELGYATWDPPGGGGPQTVQVDPQAVPYWTGTCTNTAFTDDNAVRAWDNEHGWMMFDVSAIPAGATISSIQFNGYVNNTNWPYWAISKVTSDPLTATAGEMYTDIDTGPDYNYYMESSAFPTGWKVDIIGGTANADLETALAQGWWTIGIRTDDYYITYGLTFDGWNDADPPFLMVDYETDDGIVGKTRIDLNSKVKHQERSATPNNRDFLGYNVYLDSGAGFVLVVFTTNEFYEYTGLNPGDTYMAGVTALYDEGESSMIEYEFIYNPSLFDPPENVQVDPYYGFVTWEPPGGTIYSDDFESYTVGGYLAVQSDDWTTWTNNPGSAEDAFISDDYALSPTKSVKVDGTTDLVLIMENYTTGAYSIDLNMYIPTGYCGYYNLQKTNVPGTEWGFQIMFDVTGIASIDGGAAAACTFPFDFDTWMNFEIIVDLDNDLCDFYYDGTLMHSYQWTLGTFGTPGLLQLGGVNMYAWASAGNNPLYYFDDVTLSLVSAEPSDELIGYNVYLDEVLLTATPLGINVFEYQYTDLVYYQWYTAGVSAVYDDPGESEIIEVEFMFTPTELDPPENLVATVLDYNDVHLEWELPSGTTGGILAYHDGYDNNGIGTGAAADWMCAARFTAEELAEYYGSDLTAVNVHIRTADFSYVAIKVWEGGSFGNSGIEVYSADITGSVLIEDWTEHILTTPIPLVDGNEYWIGYDMSATGDHPASVDAGPAVAGKGDWMYYTGVWQEISVAFALDYNWCIEGVVGGGDDILMTTRVAKDKVRTPQLRSMMSSGIPEALFNHSHTRRINNNRESRMLLGYKVYRDGGEIHEIFDPNELTYDDLALNEGTYEYYVTAIYDDGESIPSNLEEVTITLPIPQNLTATVQGQNNVFLNWDDVDRDLDFYRIYRDGAEIGTTSSSFYLDVGLEAGTYVYNVTAEYDGEWESGFSNDAIAEVDAGGIPLPLVTELNGNYPNPFNPDTNIKFSIHEAGDVRIDIFNSKGQKIRTLVNKYLSINFYNMVWDGKDNNGVNVSSGVYFYKMDAGRYTSTKKMILMK